MMLRAKTQITYYESAPEIAALRLTFRLEYQPLFGKGARAIQESGGNRAYHLLRVSTVCNSACSDRNRTPGDFP